MSTKKKNASRSIRDIPNGQIGWAVSHFKSSGYFDYVAARSLLLSGLPLQGLILASTCIEKYLKALLSTTGKKISTHLDSDGFIEILRMNGLNVSSYISESFVNYLGRAYEFRYIEPTSGPASIAVEQRKLLAELDYSVYRFENSPAIAIQDFGKVIQSDYAIAVESNDKNVWAENHVLQKINKKDFVEVFGPLYCMAIKPVHEIVQIRHENFKSTDNSLFDFPITKLVNDHTIHIEFGTN